MSTALAFAFGLAAGGGLVLFYVYGLCGLRRARLRRSMASALIGEIVAILRAIEIQDVVARRTPAMSPEGEPRVDLRSFTLPPFTAYQAVAENVVLFRSPLPRKIALFYSALPGLANDACAFANPAIAAEAKDRSRGTLAELRQQLDLADEILRDLRPLVSVHQPASISRA
jgi:hypothetical protein